MPQWAAHAAEYSSFSLKRSLRTPLALHRQAILAAKCEASSAYRGIGLVKLMGRHSGFIAVKVGGIQGCPVGEGGRASRKAGVANSFRQSTSGGHAAQVCPSV